MSEFNRRAFIRSAGTTFAAVVTSASVAAASASESDLAARLGEVVADIRSLPDDAPYELYTSLQALADRLEGLLGKDAQVATDEWVTFINAEVQAMRDCRFTREYPAGMRRVVGLGGGNA